MSGSIGSIDHHLGGSLSGTEEHENLTRRSGSRHWKEIKPGMLIHVTRPAKLFGLPQFVDRDTIVLVLDSRLGWQTEGKQSLMTRMAGGCLTANDGWVNALEGGMHFFPVLYEGDVITFAVWAHDDGWEPIEPDGQN